MNTPTRVVITGMSTINPLGTSLSEFFDNLMAGKSGIRRWVSSNTENVGLKIGGDIGDWDWKAHRDRWVEKAPADVSKRFRKLWKGAPFAVQIGMLAALQGYEDAKLWDLDIDRYRIAVVVGGHNFNQRYILKNHSVFLEEPEFIDSLCAMKGLDTDVGGSITEILQTYGPCYTVGGACASTNVALRSALREIRDGEADIALVVGAPYDVDGLDLQAMSIMRSVADQSFNDCPERASRPYDRDREGFVVSHGAGTLVLESLDFALSRGAPQIYAEALSASATSSGTHLPTPSPTSQARAMRNALRSARLEPTDIDFVSAHATSTPLGDLTELQAIEDVFGEHTKTLKVNAPKSMLGHCCWAAPIVESAAGILQMNTNRLHGSINIENLDPRVTLDVCADGPQDHNITHFLKNSFGFGGVNSCAVFKKYTGERSVIAS